MYSAKQLSSAEVSFQGNIRQENVLWGTAHRASVLGVLFIVELFEYLPGHGEYYKLLGDRMVLFPSLLLKCFPWLVKRKTNTGESGPGKTPCLNTFHAVQKAEKYYDWWKVVSWILIMNDFHLAVFVLSLQKKVKSLILPHNPSFETSGGWIGQFTERQFIAS